MELTGKQTEATMFRGATVFSADEGKVGEVEKVLYDKATGKPEWFAIQTGLFGFKSRLAPFPRLCAAPHAHERVSRRGEHTRALLAGTRRQEPQPHVHAFVALYEAARSGSAALNPNAEEE